MLAHYTVKVQLGANRPIMRKTMKSPLVSAESLLKTIVFHLIS